MNRERSFNTLRHHSRESSAGRSIIGRLFPPELQDKSLKAINMNDSRRQLARDPTKNFQQSKQQSQLFQKGVRKVQLELKQKTERSLSRRYYNKSSFNLNSSLAKENEEAKPQGLRRVKLQPTKSKLSERKHIYAPTQRSTQDSSLNFVVPKINSSTNNVQSKQIIIKIGRTYRKSQVDIQNRPMNQNKVLANERKHFMKQNEVVKELLTDRSIKGEMNFKHDFYRPDNRLPKQQKRKQEVKLFDDKSKRGSVSSRLFR